MLGEETRQIPGQELHHGGGVGPDPHMTAHAHGKVADIRRHAVYPVEDAARMLDQAMAGRGQLKPAWQADKQRAIGDPLQLGNALADRRQSEMGVLGRAGQTA
ncbi:hypothetical protein D9M68_901300 [compost metagenome]